MIEKLGREQLKMVGICEYFCTEKLVKKGHYNEKGNKLLAEVSALCRKLLTKPNAGLPPTTSQKH